MTEQSVWPSLEELLGLQRKMEEVHDAREVAEIETAKRKQLEILSEALESHRRNEAAVR